MFVAKTNFSVVFKRKVLGLGLDCLTLDLQSQSQMEFAQLPRDFSQSQMTVGLLGYLPLYGCSLPV